jgi:GNAT superfamily N-acetyltransferase
MDAKLPEIDLVVTDAPTPAQRDCVLETLREFAMHLVGRPDDKAYAVLVTDRAQGDIIGGLIAYSRWQEFFIDLIALPENVRGRGFGGRLLDMAEQEARNRGCSIVWLDSYAFQDNGFYEHHGFEVFARFEGPPPIYPRLFFKKSLKE